MVEACFRLCLFTDMKNESSSKNKLSSGLLISSDYFSGDGSASFSPSSVTDVTVSPCCFCLFSAFDEGTKVALAILSRASR